MIDSFSGHYEFLSNFYPTPQPIWLRLRCVYSPLANWGYPGAEYAYQAAKTWDHQWRAYILMAQTPGIAKRMAGPKSKMPLRGDWDVIRLGLMKDLLIQKFSHPILRERLLATDDHDLIEGNNWGDLYWGVCNDQGENHLGKLLMEIRSDIRLGRYLAGYFPDPLPSSMPCPIQCANCPMGLSQN